MVSDSEEDVSLYDSELSESYYTDDDDDDDDYAGAESEDDDFYRPQKPYTALVEGDIRQRQDEEISHVSATLSVSTVAASLLLYHYKWNVSQLHDAWFGDEERVRATVGLLDTDSTPRKRDQEEELICGICFELCPWDQIYPTGCGHPYCKMCWKGYITASINDGPGCLSLRCPDPSCGAAVGQDMVDELASNEEKQKYSRFFLRSFIEEKKNTKWCPSPGCENAVEFEFGSSVYDVTCLCSCTFCWNCTEDAHRPVDCDTVAKWVLKNSSESENTDWIIANSKPCPKCKRPIEKDHGCMHMTCTQPCGFQFCWLCLGAWDDHDEKTGGFYACNKYETEKLQGLHSEDDNRREIAKKSSGKYTHYYERWASNQQSRQKAMKDLRMKVPRNSSLSTFKARLRLLLKGYTIA